MLPVWARPWQASRTLSTQQHQLLPQLNEVSWTDAPSVEQLAIDGEWQPAAVVDFELVASDRSQLQLDTRQ
jgi:hypothetical protein